jgi:hypothetical protein
MTRPTIARDVLAELTRAVPERVAKKLDLAPRTAEGWTWSSAESVTVFTGAETVTLAAVTVGSPEDARCTCLLSPRCFHLLAVLTVLPIAEAATTAEPDVGSSGDDEVTSQPPGPSELQALTAQDAARVASHVVADGLSRVSTLRLGELVRVAHACRRSGLVRLESCVMGVFDAARALRDESPDFVLDRAVDTLAELLLVATKLEAGEMGEWVGVARRSYREVASLKLAGVACEPVVSKGYAGVVTYFTDGARIYTSQEVLPGDLDRAIHAYDAQLRFGEISLSHREASREGLLFATPRVSWDNRLGAGKDVTCARTARDAATVARLFDEPLGAQLDRAERGEDHGLIFVRGIMRSGRVDATKPWGSSLPLIVPIDHPRFAYRENLERLAAASAEVSLVAKKTDDGRAFAPVAVILEGRGLINLAYDRLNRADLVAAAPDASHASAPERQGMPGNLAPVHRRLLRFALVGHQSMPSAALPEVALEGARLRASLLPTAADALETLATAPRDKPGRLAAAWLVLHVYCQGAERSLARSAWGLSP